MRYVQVKQELYLHDWAYRVYVTDALRVITGATMRYVDIVEMAQKPEPEEQDADEIKERIVGKLRAMGR